MLKFFSLFFLITVSFTAVSSTASKKCELKFQQAQTCVSIEFLKPPGRKGDAKFKLNFTDLSGKVKSLKAPPKVHLWMIMKNGHEHGAEKLKIEKKGKYYLLSNVWFLMLGQWQVHVSFSNNGKLEKGHIPVCIKRKSAESYIGLCK